MSYKPEQTHQRSGYNYPQLNQQQQQQHQHQHQHQQQHQRHQQQQQQQQLHHRQTLPASQIHSPKQVNPGSNQQQQQIPSSMGGRPYSNGPDYGTPNGSAASQSPQQQLYPFQPNSQQPYHQQQQASTSNPVGFTSPQVSVLGASQQQQIPQSFTSRQPVQTQYGSYLPDAPYQQHQPQYQAPQQVRAYDPNQLAQQHQQQQQIIGTSNNSAPYPYNPYGGVIPIQPTDYRAIPAQTTDVYIQQGPPIPQQQQMYPPYPIPSSFSGTMMRAPIMQPNLTPKIVTLKWGYQNTMCYGVEARGVPVLRRADNNLVNGTKLLKVAKLTRGRRDRILKSEKDRHVIKTGPMKFKGVWIPLERASTIAQREGIYYALYPLFEPNIRELIEPLPRMDAAGLPYPTPQSGNSNSTLSGIPDERPNP